MKRFLGLVAIGLALSTSGSAYADSITSTITAISPLAGQLSGTVTVDTALGTVTAIDLTLIQGVSTLTFDSLLYQSSLTNEYYFTSLDGNGDALLIGFEGASLSNFTASTPICTNANVCSNYTSFFAPATGQGATFDSGTPSALTPEPSSLILLGSGVLGVAGVIRRRTRTA
jgi:hypothetical protein